MKHYRSICLAWLVIEVAACSSVTPPGATSPSTAALSEHDLTATAHSVSHPPTDTGQPHNLTALDLTLTAEASGPVQSTPVAQPGAPWLMFRGDPAHTAITQGVGNIDPNIGPVVRWAYQLVEPQTSPQMRWASGFPLGDLDGDGSLEVIVTSPDGASLSPRVVVLKDTPGQTPPVRELWTFDLKDEKAGVDQYSAALVDADDDGLLDVVFTARNGFIYALKGTNGSVIWQYNAGRIMESGPMVADLDGDGQLELVQVTDCVLNGCPNGGALLVFAAQASGENPPLWSKEYAWKSDSGEPAITDLDPNDGTARQAIVFGNWGGVLNVVWQAANGDIISNSFDLRQLDPAIPHDSDKVVVRSSPTIYDWGEGPSVVLGWMPDHDYGTDARFSAIGLQVDMSAGTVQFIPRWTFNQDTWKSSPALIPVPNSQPLVVAGTGVGVKFGTSFECTDVVGGVVARTGDGDLAWEVDLRPKGNVRGSVAVADVDGDGQAEVLLPVGCGGELIAYDGATGREEWRFNLGPYTFTTPSVGDLDGDGALEIVIASYDGKVYALGGSR